MTKNVENVKKIFFRALPRITYEDCECRKAIETAAV
jgi:hypothetical protein